MSTETTNNNHTADDDELRNPPGMDDFNMGSAYNESLHDLSEYDNVSSIGLHGMHIDGATPEPANMGGNNAFTSGANDTSTGTNTGNKDSHNGGDPSSKENQAGADAIASINQDNTATQPMNGTNGQGNMTIQDHMQAAIAAQAFGTASAAAIGTAPAAVLGTASAAAIGAAPTAAGANLGAAQIVGRPKVPRPRSPSFEIIEERHRNIPRKDQHRGRSRTFTPRDRVRARTPLFEGGDEDFDWNRTPSPRRYRRDSRSISPAPSYARARSPPAKGTHGRVPAPLLWLQKFNKEAEQKRNKSDDCKLCIAGEHVVSGGFYDDNCPFFSWALSHGCEVVQVGSGASRTVEYYRLGYKIPMPEITYNGAYAKHPLELYWLFAELASKHREDQAWVQNSENFWVNHPKAHREAMDWVYWQVTNCWSDFHHANLYAAAGLNLFRAPGFRKPNAIAGPSNSGNGGGGNGGNGANRGKFGGGKPWNGVGKGKGREA